MDHRRRIVRAGLLVFFLLAFLSAFFCGAGLWAQEGGTPAGTAAGESVQKEDIPLPLEARLETSPANPMVNNSWIIAVLVNHPNPQDVNVKPPRFPSALVLERVRTETRSIQGERWTRVEFLFTPQREGTFTLEPFAVTVQGRLAESNELSVRFREEERTVRRYEPRFRWTAPLSPLKAGEGGELFLDLTNWDPSRNPPRGFLQGRAPRNAILEEAFPEEQGEGSFRYAIHIIPLEGRETVLEPVSFQAEGFSLSIPGITLPVLPAAMEPVQSSQPESFDLSAGSASGENFEEQIETGEIREMVLNIPFPGDFMTAEGIENGSAFLNENPETVFPFFGNEYRRIITKVRDLWENDRRAEALAEIRRNERDSLQGRFLIPLRREMERVLGIDFTENERWQPLKISLVSWMILGFLVISVPLAFLVFRPRKGVRRNRIFSINKVSLRNVTSVRRSGFKTIIILVFLIGVVVISLEEGMGNFLVGRINSSRNNAVLEKTVAYRIPDTRGAVNAWFDEGQPVTVSDFHLDWCYAETADGRFGWVKREAVITY